MRFQAEQHELDEANDPVDFWVSVENHFPLLSSIAYDILVIPASSAPVERKGFLNQWGVLHWKARPIERKEP